MLAAATIRDVDIMRSLPIGLYLEQPITWLHRLDPRIKLFWLLSFLLSPTLANAGWRIAVVVILIGLTLSTRIPMRIWKQQMGLLLLLATMTFTIATFSGDGLNVNPQPRRPVPEVSSGTAINLPQPTNYRYVLWEIGSVKVSRRSLDLGIRVSTLIFTFLYAPTLYLLVTAPEEITSGVTALAAPLKRMRVPIIEIMLTLTLALRFVPLVLEEIQNLVRAIRTRAINWKHLGFKHGMQIWLLIVERLISNIFMRAEQTANAMQVRGFTSPEQHQVRWNPLKLMGWDILVGIILVLFWGLRVWMGGE